MPRFSLRVGKPDEEAPPHATIRRSNACSGAHNRVIAARLASHFDAQMLGAGQREKTNITIAEIELSRAKDLMPPVL
ncbi:MAG: hypothetical protein QNI88_02865 [Desulfobacterales bacterium]|nr:hypothetical protein [Desulfobacterales bacterium]